MITVDRKRGVYTNPGQNFRVAHRYGRVYLIQGDRAMEFDTPTAVRVGLALAKLSNQLEQGEFLELNLDGEEINILPDSALKLSGALIRKADMADDWQRALVKH